MQLRSLQKNMIRMQTCEIETSFTKAKKARVEPKHKPKSRIFILYYFKVCTCSISALYLGEHSQIQPKQDKFELREKMYVFFQRCCVAELFSWENTRIVKWWHCGCRGKGFLLNTPVWQDREPKLMIN